MESMGNARYKKPTASDAQIEEIQTLLALESGINGYPHICHGGTVATNLDEVMGILLSVNKDWEEVAALFPTIYRAL
jgi:hypothetical protein